MGAVGPRCTCLSFAQRVRNEGGVGRPRCKPRAHSAFHHLLREGDHADCGLRRGRFYQHRFIKSSSQPEWSGRGGNSANSTGPPRPRPEGGTPLPCVSGSLDSSSLWGAQKATFLREEPGAGGHLRPREARSLRGPHSEASAAQQRHCASAGPQPLCPRAGRARARTPADLAPPRESPPGWSAPRSQSPRGPDALVHLADSIPFPRPTARHSPPPTQGPASLRARPARAHSAPLGVLIGHPGPARSP